MKIREKNFEQHLYEKLGTMHRIVYEHPIRRTWYLKDIDFGGRI